MLSYFFKHTSIKQILIKNTFWLSSSTLVGRLVKFFLVTQAALILTPEGYGTFIYLLSTIQLFFGISDLGISSIFKRDFQNEAYDKKALVGTFLCLKVFTIVVYTLGALSLLYWWPKPIETLPFLILIGVTAFTQLYTGINTYFLAKNRFEVLSLVTLVDMFVTTGVGLYMLSVAPSLTSLSLAYGIGSVSAFVLSFIFLLVFLRHSITFSGSMAKYIITEAAPSSGANVIYMLLNTMDVIIIEHFLGATHVGYYSVAQRCYRLVMNIPTILKTTLFPIMSSLQGSVNDLARLLRKSTMVLLIISVPALVGGILLAEPLIYHLFSSNYADSVLPLQVFFGSLPIVFLVGIYVQSLVIIKKQHLVFVFSIITSVLNIGLSILFVQPFGIAGVSAASFIALFIGFILPFSVLHQHCDERLFSYRQMVPIFLSSLGMGGFLLYFQAHIQSIYLLVISGTLMYGLFLLLLREYHTTALLQDLRSKLFSS